MNLDFVAKKVKFQMFLKTPTFQRLLKQHLINIFKENLQWKLLYCAMKDVFSSKFNVKENILKILKGPYIKENIMGKRLLYVFENAIVGADNSRVCPSLDTLAELESEFLQK